MNSSTRYLFAIGTLYAAALLAAPSVRAQKPDLGPETISIGQSQWNPVPSILPQGAKVTFVSGDPYKLAEFTVEFAMPDQYTLPPHSNPASEHVMIKSGALRVGLGNRIDRAKSFVLGAGDTATTPVGVPHWSIAEGETHIVVAYAAGPFCIAYMSKGDEPGSHSFPFSY